VAAAVGLALRDNYRLGLAERAFTPGVFSFEHSRIVFDVHAWETLLVEELGQSTIAAGSIAASYILWYQSLTTAPAEFIRWLCHGHCGMSALWAGYLKCVDLVSSGDQVEIAYANRAKADTRQDAASATWALGVTEETSKYPKEVFVLLSV
jgi:hypothetical protein